jgi:hypothetical protein
LVFAFRKKVVNFLEFFGLDAAASLAMQHGAGDAALGFLFSVAA